METYSNNLIVFDMNTIAMYLIAFVAGFNWRLGMLSRRFLHGSIKARGVRMKDRLAWLAGYLIQALAILLLMWLVVNRYCPAWMQINSWLELLHKGSTYIVIFWLCGFFVAAIEINIKYPSHQYGYDHDIALKLWLYCWIVLFIFCAICWVAWASS